MGHGEQSIAGNKTGVAAWCQQIAFAYHRHRRQPTHASKGLGHRVAVEPRSGGDIHGHQDIAALRDADPLAEAQQIHQPRQLELGRLRADLLVPVPGRSAAYLTDFLCEGAELDRVLFVGGGSVALAESIRDWFPNQAIAEHPAFANARGMLKYLRFVCEVPV